MAGMTAVCGRCGREEVAEEQGDIRPGIGEGRLVNWAYNVLSTRPPVNTVLCPWCVVVVRRVLDMVVAHPSQAADTDRVAILPAGGQVPPPEVLENQVGA